MLKFILLSLLQTILLASGQVCLKVSMERMDKFSFTWVYFKQLLTNWYFALAGVLFLSATVLWMYILKHYPFSIAYPITSFAYVFGMLAAFFIFREAIPPTRWIGVFLIVTGIFFLLKQ
ncbi:MAG: EamA family transporter [Bacteroidales bacterium]|jgi:drug/metabolite transporter (DMT)-like permease|nr:EamA family transporter [Bacteroidales bacterium]MDD2264303.1 EamA family transporter [Bacteroidales bacterium]MDD2831537.1 EamA family transporter [Bacteroidales bacterium]MDD3208531.1 EamA family transporter [Bacteroidales bacterium]MDD3697056.1 EamA family transporter [Bacteroidales bacterium]